MEQTTLTAITKTRFNIKTFKIGVIVLFVAALALGLLAGNHRISTVHAFAEGPPAGLTGAPGEATCVECHAGAPVNSGPGAFTITVPDNYVPGNTYQITVRHATNDLSRKRWGFELTTLDNHANQAGNLQSTGDLTQVRNNGGPAGNRQYIEHTVNGTFAGTTGGVSWTFNWVAPANNVGPVTFYAAGNEANGDGTSANDQIYTVQATINPADVNPPGHDPVVPVVLSATVSGKKLLVTGQNFDDGAVLLLNGERQKKTINDADNPTTLLIAKKSGRLIVPGQTVSLQVRNLDGRLSDTFMFTNPNN